MEPTNFDSITAHWWVCCGQLMCIKCEEEHDKFVSPWERPLCLCTATSIGTDETKISLSTYNMG